MKPSRIILIIAAAALLVLAATATARRGATNDPTGDLFAQPPSGISRSAVDLTHVSTARIKGKVQVTITVAGLMGNALSRDHTAPAFFIDNPDPLAEVLQKRGKYGVYQFQTKLLSRAVTEARPDKHTLVLTFSPSAVGGLGNYKWYVLMGQGCVAYDRAPNTTSGVGRVSERC